MTTQTVLFPIDEYHVELPRIVAKIEIQQDVCRDTPREVYNLGTMVTRKRVDEVAGDRSVSDKEMNDLVSRCNKEKSVHLPIYALIHSGVWISTESTFACDPGGWDTSFAGIIYVEDEKLIEEYGAKNEETVTKAIACLEEEVKTYNQFLQGEVYSYSTFDTDGEEIDSCGGFYGADPFTNGMSECIDAQYHDLLKSAVENIKYE